MLIATAYRASRGVGLAAIERLVRASEDVTLAVALVVDEPPPVRVQVLAEHVVVRRRTVPAGAEGHNHHR